jgi:hypothetical protein
VWGSELTTKAVTLQGGSADFAAKLKVKLWDLTGELELELIQTHMAQKPMLRVEVCARCVESKCKRLVAGAIIFSGTAEFNRKEPPGNKSCCIEPISQSTEFCASIRTRRWANAVTRRPMPKFYAGGAGQCAPSPKACRYTPPSPQRSLHGSQSSRGECSKTSYFSRSGYKRACHRHFLFSVPNCRTEFLTFLGSSPPFSQRTPRLQAYSSRDIAHIQAGQ